MPESRLIGDYLAALSARLPGRIVEELADGVDQTYRSFREQGLDQDAAARACICEFGDPRLIAAGFTASCSARQTARRLLIAGPGAGLCWGGALITSRAWTWPVPLAGRAVFGAALLLSIALLTAAALGRHYRTVGRTAVAGSAVLTLLDLSAVSLVIANYQALTWVVAIAASASAARIGYTVSRLHRMRTAA